MVATIMHVDMDAFYAAVELRRRPELRDRQVVVGGAERGVVLSANYPARARGVRSGMSSSQARRLAPQAVFIAPEFERYAAVSRAIVEIFCSVSAVVEAVSIDEAFLDVTGALRAHGCARALGERLRATVADEQQITCSVGIGPSKFVAKVASRAAKPDGLVEVPPDQVCGFLHPLPVAAMWGVGPATTEKLHQLGIETVGDLARTPVAALRPRFGPRFGAALVSLAWGRDARRVLAGVSERSVGAQETLAVDTERPDDVRRELLRMADRVARRARSANMLGRTVVLCLRFADFGEITRSLTLDSPTDVAAEIHAAAMLSYARLGLGRARIRRVGVRLEGLVDADRAYRQPSLTDPETGWREAEHAVDATVNRFGAGAVQRAALTGGRSRNRSVVEFLPTVPPDRRAT